MRRFRRAALVAAAACLLLAGTAYALTAEVGNTIISATAEVTPRELPENGSAPVEVTSTTRVKAKDGSMPPALKKLEFEFDKYGAIDTKGLPVCTRAKLENTTPLLARKRCASSLVGTGMGEAQVQLPGQAPVKVRSKLSFFNAPPSGGRPTLIAHGYETIPSPQALLVPIVIERVSHGRYGYRARVEVPPIAEGYGAATLAQAKIGMSFQRGGKTVGYVSASCHGGRLQVQGKAFFVNGDLFPATLASSCHPPH